METSLVLRTEAFSGCSLFYEDETDHCTFFTFGDLLNHLIKDYISHKNNGTSPHGEPIFLDLKSTSSKKLEKGVDFFATYEVFGIQSRKYIETISISCNELTGYFMTRSDYISIPDRITQFLLTLTKNGCYATLEDEYKLKSFLAEISDPTHWKSNRHDEFGN
ncbi:hypothetical protein A8L34_28160 [Bacillus sp. FJAT-27264]|uniref:hypothetical protein n=1 Tax=Paenibacillus sp. (strain DSM 101736 / FJAT-27264) TaxID=1850362 RepID=UPI000807D245|nr:hypothetical protein [Bacillus sp. FJAT-27264]OBZ15923.1 hypothetical protein A8L34_28160 [Bacillus sp. FJAT-27264]